MNMKLENEFRAKLGPEFDHSAKPHVYFFDHAILVPSDGRPRYKNAVYISKTSKTSIGTQDFHAKATEQDQLEFAAEWAHYLAVRDNLSKPRVGMLPGIDVATLKEMKAIEIYTLEQLLAQDEFEPWKDMARRIIDATHGTEERKVLQGDDPERRANRVGTVGVLGRDRSTITGSGEKESRKEEESYQEKSYQKEIVTFDFEMTL